MKRTVAALLNQVGVEHSRPQPGLTQGRMPDVVGIGAQRCGTSWLFRVLVDAGVLAPPVVAKRSGVKELHAFDRNRPLTNEQYARFFDPDAALTGEWTPSYFHSARAVEHLAALPEQTRFLLLVRDPMTRATSGLRHEAARHLRLSPALADDAASRSRYYQQWERLTRHLDPHRVLVLQFERLTTSPDDQLERLWSFLGVRPTAPPPLERAPRNASADVSVPPAVTERLDAARADLRRDAERFVAATGDAIEPSLWATLREH